jgi:hypothetical protein
MGTVRTVAVLLVVIAAAFIYHNRQTLFVRDPMATVYRTEPAPTGKAGAAQSAGEVKQSGVEVYINYSNDVLLEKEDDPGSYRILVQGWNEIPATPIRLTCLRWMACMTEDDHSPTLPLVATNGSHAKYDPQVVMSSREITFVDPDGVAFRVALR